MLTAASSAVHRIRCDTVLPMGLGSRVRVARERPTRDTSPPVAIRRHSSAVRRTALGTRHQSRDDRCRLRIWTHLPPARQVDRRTSRLRRRLGDSTTRMQWVKLQRNSYGTTTRTVGAVAIKRYTG